MTLSEFQPNRSTATLASIKPSFQTCACKARFYARQAYACNIRNTMQEKLLT